MRARRWGTGVLLGWAALAGVAGAAIGQGSGGVGPAAPAVAASGVWSAVGPVAVNSLSYGLVTGRITALALDPSDATGNHLFVGTTGGGVWRTLNGAAASGSVQFTPVTDNLAALANSGQPVARAGLSVGAITVQPGGTGVVLAGLGDVNDALDSYAGAGLLRSTNGGQTWTLITQTMDLEDNLGLQDFSFVGEGFAGFAWSTANPQLVVAAVSQSYEGTLVNAGESGASYKGLYWSSDGGATWHLGRITDLDGEDVQGPLDGFALPDGNAATSVVWNPVRQVFVAAVQYHGYYQSTDGMNWTQLGSQPGTGLTAGNCPTEAGGVGVPGCPIFRGSLAVNPETGDTFAWTVDAFNQDQGIWWDQCAIEGGACGNGTITFGVQLGSSALEVSDGNGPATIENGDYNLTLAAVPGGLGAGQDTLLFAGADDLWKCSLANSCAWRNTTNSTSCMSAAVAEYEHALAWDAANPLLVYAGTDGGLWRSVDQVGETGAVCAATDATHWQNLNANLGPLVDVVSVGQSAASPGTMLVGLGSNGFAGIVGAPATAGDWNEVLGGEGGTAAIDPTHANSWYGNNEAGVSIFHCTAAAGTACTAAGFGSSAAVGEAQVAEDGLSMGYPADFLVDAADPTQLLVGTCRVWRGPETGAGWSGTNAISPVLDGTGGSFCDGNALIRSMAATQTTGGGEAIYVGMAGEYDGGGVIPGHVFAGTVSSAGVAGNWTDVGLSPVGNDPLAFNAFGLDVTGLYADPHDASGNTVYATVGGYASTATPLEQLYRSTNGGAQWTAIRSNLPDAPVNAVVVDTQNASTVYVATDVGVFSTSAVGSCATAACWTQYGTGLPLAPVKTLVETPLGASTAALTAGTYGRGVWQIAPASAATTLTTATTTPTALTFTGTTVGSAAAVQAVVVRVTGTANLTVTGIGFTGSGAGDFSETDNCVNTPIARAGSCTVKVTFTPTQTGARSAELTIGGNVAGGQLLVGLSGTGLATGSITLMPSSLSFGTQLVATTSAAQNFALQNVGGSTVAIGSITVSAPFVKSANSCGTSLAAGTACAVSVEFAPTLAGAATGSITVVDGLGTQSAALSGTGVTGPTDTLSATSLSFPATVVGQLSAAQTVTLTNNGGETLTSIGSSVAGDFLAVNNCGSELAAGSSCGISVEFAPTLVAQEAGSLVISDGLRAQTVKLSGFGEKPPAITVSRTSINFGSVGVGASSAAVTLSVTNSGGAALLTPSFTIGGPGAASFALGTTTCGASLAAQSACTVQVTFTPGATGTLLGTLTVSSASYGVTPVTVSLTGVGLTPPMLTVAPTDLNLGTVIVDNSSAPFTVRVTNSGQVAMAEPAFAVSGAEAGDFALSAPTDIAACTGALAAGASCNIQVTFSPSLAATESATLTVTASNASPGMATVTLTGTGAASIVLEANPGAVNFAATAVGTTSAYQLVTISNLGRQPANGLTLTLSGPYGLVAAESTCGGTLARNSFCTAAVSFSPTASGSQPGALTVAVTNLGVSPLTVGLSGSGVGVGGIETTPAEMTFGSEVLGTASPAQTLTVTNSGQAALTGVTIAATGAYSLTGNLCGTVLAAQASCTTGVVFEPTATGVLSGELTINTTSTGVPPAVVSLTGNGIPAGSLTASPAVVSFGAFTLGSTSGAQTVTLTNSGATTLGGLQFGLAGDYGLPGNNCGSQIASGGICSFSVTFSPTLPGTRIGSVTVRSTNAGFTPLVVGLTGTGLPTAQLTATPGQLSFGSVGEGSDSAAQQVTVSNPGSGALAGLLLTTAAPFSLGSGSCGASLAAGASCVAPVTFAPKVTGLQNGVVTISSTSLGVRPVTVGLSGTGLGPAALTLTPGALKFAATTIGATSAGQMMTVTDSGGVGLAGLTVTASGDFAISSSNCGGTLAAGGSCSVVVSFTPSAAGGRLGFLTAGSTTLGAGNAPLTATGELTGTGLTGPLVAVLPAQLAFAATLIGATSATGLVSVTNVGQTETTALALAVTAGFELDPAKTTCAGVLAAGARCTVGVYFAPTAGGAQVGSLTASLGTGTGAGTAATVSLSGTGALPPALVTAPTTLVQLGTTPVGKAATPIAITVTNEGTLTAVTGLALAVNAAGIAGGFGLSGNGCGSVAAPGKLGPGASCTANVTFLPATAGVFAGTLTVTSANGGGPQTLALSGGGFDFAFAVSGSASATVTQGQTGYYTLTATPLGATSAGDVYGFSCGTLPANALCVFNPAELTGLPAKVTGNARLGIATGGPVAGLSGRGWRGAGLLLCCLAGLPLTLLRRIRAFPRTLRVLLAGLALAGAAGAVSSCAGAGGQTGEVHVGGGTPTGSYKVQVTASANGVSHAVSVTLVVN